MTHFSQAIEALQKGIETKRTTQRSRQPPPFQKKKEKRSKLSEEVNQDLLNALKQVLAEQKKPEAAIQMEGTSKVSIEKLSPSAQVMQLFETLVDKMQMLKSEGIQETTFFLNDSAFSSSLFKGASITITEYSTAPKVFNISFQATTEALHLFEAHAASLMSTLQNGQFGFGVHRIETALLKEEIDRSQERVERDLEKEDER